MERMLLPRWGRDPRLQRIPVDFHASFQAGPRGPPTHLPWLCLPQGNPFHAQRKSKKPQEKRLVKLAIQKLKATKQSILIHMVN